MRPLLGVRREGESPTKHDHVLLEKCEDSILCGSQFGHRWWVVTMLDSCCCHCGPPLRPDRGCSAAGGASPCSQDPREGRATLHPSTCPRSGWWSQSRSDSDPWGPGYRFFLFALLDLLTSLVTNSLYECFCVNSCWGFCFLDKTVANTASKTVVLHYTVETTALHRAGWRCADDLIPFKWVVLKYLFNTYSAGRLSMLTK